jgi:hypothetical protein
MGDITMWSKQLTELSRSYFEIGCCNVKSETGNFGFLIVDNTDRLYKISIFNSDEILIYHSVSELIEAGWAVD